MKLLADLMVIEELLLLLLHLLFFSFSRSSSSWSFTSLKEYEAGLSGPSSHVWDHRIKNILHITEDDDAIQQHVCIQCRLFIKC
jgi:hypothetical protein